MATAKNIIKALIPPVILTFLKPKNANPQSEIWAGDYSSWAEAKKNCSGYDSEIILEKCKSSLLKVKNGEAVYERDSVIFNEIQYSWGLLAGLQNAALENNGNLCVLDFGGSLGSTYYQNKTFLNSVKNLKWCIVEQANFVDCGKKYFEDDTLKFYHTIEECMGKEKPNVLVLSSVMQYLDKPYEWLNTFLNLDIATIIFDRTAFVERENDLLTTQNEQEHIYNATYPAWFFGSNFLKSITGKYKIIATFDNGFTRPICLNQKYKGYWKGIILKK
ncbi:MAG: methyltransferase, TIGR04325 family [Bacteroidia bacterium]